MASLFGMCDRVLHIQRCERGCESDYSKGVSKSG